MLFVFCNSSIREAREKKYRDARAGEIYSADTRGSQIKKTKSVQIIFM